MKILIALSILLTFSLSHAVENHFSVATGDSRGTIHVYTSRDGHFINQGKPLNVLLRATCGKDYRDWTKATLFDGEGVCDFIKGSLTVSADSKKITFKYRKSDDNYYSRHENDGGKPRCVSAIEEFSFDITTETGLCSF